MNKSSFSPCFFVEGDSAKQLSLTIQRTRVLNSFLSILMALEQLIAIGIWAIHGLRWRIFLSLAKSRPLEFAIGPFHILRNSRRGGE